MSAAAEPWRALYPFEPRVFTHPDGTRQSYVDVGTGDPVLMLHGNPTWSFYYRNLVAGLGATRRAIAVDHVGCGLSDKPRGADYRLAAHVERAERLVTALGLERITLVVHDWGGPIGFGLAQRDLSRIARIVVLNTAAFLVPRCPWRIRACRVPVLGPLMVRGANAFVRGLTWMASVKPLPAAVRAGYLYPYDSWAHRIAVSRFVLDIPLAPTHPSHATMRAIEDGLGAMRAIPMLILWGMRDWCFSPDFLEGWRQRFPDAEVHAWDDAHHLVLEDAPDRALAAIERFLA